MTNQYSLSPPRRCISSGERGYRPFREGEKRSRKHNGGAAGVGPLSDPQFRKKYRAAWREVGLHGKGV